MSGAIKKTEIVEADLNQLADELKIVGDNIMRIVEISAKVKPIAGLGELSKATKETSDNSAELDRIGKKLALSEQRLKDLLDQRTKSIIANNKATQEQVAEMKRQSTIANSVEDSYEGINAALNSNIIAYKKLSQAQRENDAVGGQLIKTIQTQDAALKKLDADMGRNQRNVGNYKSGFNGLNFSIMQVGRELPSLAYGVNIFAAAISNNIPMVTDEIKRAKLELAALKKEGIDGVPIWKQFASAIFSWQTAMVVALTLFTMYGKEIVGWIGGLFKAKSAVDKLKTSQEELSKANLEGGKNAQAEVQKLRILYNAITDTTTATKDKKLAIDQLQRQYPDYLKNFTDEELMAGKATTAYWKLTNSIIATAKAKARKSQIDKNAEEQFGLEQERDRLIDETTKLQDEKDKATKRLAEGGFGRPQELFDTQEIVNKGNEQLRILRAQTTNLNTQIQLIEDRNKKLSEGIKVSDLVDPVKEGKGGKDKSITEAERLSKLREDIRKDDFKIALDSQNDINKQIEDARKEDEKSIKDGIFDIKKYRDFISNQTLSDAEETIHLTAIANLEAANEEILNAKGNADKIRDVQDQLETDLIESERRILQAKLDSGLLTVNDADQVQKRINSLEENALKKNIDTTTRTEEEKKQIRNETMQATNELLQSGLSFAQSIYSQQADMAQQAYDTEMQAAGDSLEAQTLAKRKFEAEDKKIKQRQAIASKLQAVLEAGLALALAIATTWKNPLLAALNIGAATIGLGMALTTPIPQFAEGTDFAPSSFIAGEEGSELIRTKSGKMILTPNKATLFSDNSLIGSSVTPADETQRMLANMAFNQVREVVDMRETNTHLSGIEKNTRNRESKYVDSKGRTVVKRGTVNSIL